VLNHRVHLGQMLLVSPKVIKLAVVRLYVAVLCAEHKRALAGNLDNANFLATVPALVLIRLNRKRKLDQPLFG
jgi:ABC-type proline/glycine betaine transport system permease subunit